MSKCVPTSSVFGESDALLRFVESIHIGGKPIAIAPNTEVLFNPRNLETLVRAVDIDKLSVISTKFEIQESVTANVVQSLDERLSAFEARIEQLLAKKP
jgi:hypothetical protein